MQLNEMITCIISFIGSMVSLGIIIVKFNINYVNEGFIDRFYILICYVKRISLNIPALIIDRDFF